MRRLHTLLVLLSSSLLSSHAQSADDLYILIDEVSVFNCRGVRNEIKVTEDDIDIVNERGHKVYYIRAPGNYTLDFRKISVKENFGFLAGEIGITLQVPIIEGPAGIRFDLPYTMVPETTLLSQKCDAHSGIVERDGKQYCRYCDLCGVSSQVERELAHNGGHQFLPSMGDGSDASFAQSCGSIERNSYSFKRTISLPSRSTLESMIKEKVHGVDGEIKKRLNKGRGRFQVFLNLISAEKPSMTQSRWFAQSQECRCCLNPREPGCSSVSFLYCNIEDCKSSWAQMCLHNTARIAACYTVEFNYRMSTSYADVQRFLQEKGLVDAHYDTRTQLTRKVINPSVAGPSSRVVPRLSSSSSQSAYAAALAARQQQAVEQQRLREQQQQQQQSVVETAASSASSAAERCVAQMAPRLQHLRRYCTIFWNAKLCCAHCDGVC